MSYYTHDTLLNYSHKLTSTLMYFNCTISLQLNSAHSTWFIKRAVLLAWIHAHFWTPVHCVRTTKWTAASVLLVSAVSVFITLKDSFRFNLLSVNVHVTCVLFRNCV